MSGKNDSIGENQNFRQFLKDNASVTFGLDGRIFPTIKYLIFRPGKLSKAFIDGDTESYTPPTTLYFTINLLFFLLLPIVNSGGIRLLSFSYQGFVEGGGAAKKYILEDMKTSGLAEEVYQAHFDAFITYNQPALIFILIPFLILVLKLIHVKHRSGFLSHTVYSFHLMSFYLISFLILGTLVNSVVLVIKNLSAESLIPYLFTVPLALYALWFFYYLFKSVREVYGGPIWIAIVKSFALLASMIVLMFLYTRFLLVLSVLNVN